jgi:hypothetical protein
MQKVANSGSMQIIKYSNGFVIGLFSIDSAMKYTEGVEIPQLESNKGGIDLNSVDGNLQVNATGEALRFNIDPAILEAYRQAPGFSARILLIEPMRDLPGFFGLSQGDTSPSPAV